MFSIRLRSTRTTLCTTLCRVTKEDEGEGKRERGRKKRRKKKKEERTYVRTLRIFTANSSSHFRFFFFFFSSLVLFTLFFSFATSKSSQSHRPTVWSSSRFARAFLFFLCPPPLPPLPDDIKWRCSRRWSILVPNSQLASSNDDKS